MRYRDLDKTINPPTVGDKLYQDLKLLERLKIQKAVEQNRLLSKEQMMALKEDAKDLTNKISVKCKKLLLIIDEHEKDKNEK